MVLRRTLTNALRMALIGGRCFAGVRMTPRQQRRCISALYISGDLAKENFIALQPYLDFKKTFSNKEQLERSIAQRQLDVDLSRILEMYARYEEVRAKLATLEAERHSVAQQLRELANSDTNKDTVDKLKEQGKALRNEAKALKQDFQPVEDEFIISYLNLPNVLHELCPTGGHEKVLYRSKLSERRQCGAKSHLEREDLVRFLDNSQYYMMNEAAEFDIYCTQAMVRHFVEQGGYLQTANPDFVRRVLLEANGTPLERYHVVAEQHLQNNLNVAYLTGGASFESFLGAVTKLCVYPSVLPLRFVSCGRCYEKMPALDGVEQNLFTATQTNAVQVFVAAATAPEADEHLEQILNLCVDFYKAFHIHFRIIYVDAGCLTSSECLRAQIEVYSPAQQRYVCVGRISNYTDYVSKRILFSARQQKEYQFLHLVGGPVLYTSRLIAALIEHDVPLGQFAFMNEIIKRIKFPQKRGKNACSQDKEGLFEEVPATKGPPHGHTSHATRHRRSLRDDVRGSENHIRHLHSAGFRAQEAKVSESLRGWSDRAAFERSAA